VLRLERVAFGPLRLGDLPLGRHRLLKAAEVEQLRRAATRPSGARRR
jgi:23S rRNA pseudouridine2605 synthase